MRVAHQQCQVAGGGGHPDASLAGLTDASEGAPQMTDMTCPNCSGTGYTQDAAGEDVVCPLCDGTGVLVTDEGDAGTV
jgi:hypothetical protein